MLIPVTRRLVVAPNMVEFMHRFVCDCGTALLACKHCNQTNDARQRIAVGGDNWPKLTGGAFLWTGNAGEVIIHRDRLIQHSPGAEGGKRWWKQRRS